MHSTAPATAERRAPTRAITYNNKNSGGWTAILADRWPSQERSKIVKTLMLAPAGTGRGELQCDIHA
jgi:hypothetical protein